MVAAVVVVRGSVVAVAFVPDLFDHGQGGGLTLVHHLNKSAVHFFAEAGSAWFNSEGFVKKIVAPSNNVHEVSNRACAVPRAIKVDVNAAAVIYNGSSLS